MKLKNLHKTSSLDVFTANTTSSVTLPLVEPSISAGFPSPASDFLDLSIDLNKEFIQNPSSTFYGRVKGDSMKDCGIDDGDLLIIDKSIEPQNGKIAVCYIDGDFTVKRIKIDSNGCWLIAENKKYKAIRVTKENDFLIWGTVLHSIKSF